MRHYTLSLLLGLFCLSNNNVISQNLTTTWIQEFESDMDIIDVPLVEKDFIYIHLKKGGNKQNIADGKHFLQKRRINDNTLIKEISIELNNSEGKELDFFGYRTGLSTLNSDIYIIASYVSKKEKKGYAYSFKLNKESMEFELNQTILEDALVGKENFSVYSYVLQLDSEELLIVNTSKTKNNSIYADSYDKHNYSISNGEIIEYNLEEYNNLEIKDKIMTKAQADISIDSYSEKIAPKLNCNNVEYIDCAMAFNKGLEKGINYYSLVRKKDKENEKYQIHVMNYNSNFFEELRKSQLKDYENIIKNRKIDNCKLYDEFYFNADAYDYVGMFKMSENNYFFKLDKYIMKSPSVGDVKTPNVVFFSELEIAKINDAGKFEWYKKIDRPKYQFLGGKELFYQFKKD